MKNLIVSILVTVILIPCYAQKKTELALNLKEGSVYKQTSEANLAITQDINGQKMNIEMMIKGTMAFAVKSISGEDYNMDAKYENLKMTIAMQGQTMEFSSEKEDESDMLSKVLRSMKGRTFNVIMNKKGRVKKVADIESMWGEIIDQIAEVPQAGKEQLKGQILKAYGEEAVKGNIEAVTAIYPDGPVKKADKWTVKTNIESGMSALVTTEYELAELASGYYLIKGKGVLETKDKDAYVETNGMPMKYDLKGSIISEVKIDKTTGWIVEAKISQEVSGDTYIKENPQVPNGMKIPMTIMNKTTVTNN